MTRNKDTKHIEEIRAYHHQTIDCKVLESKNIDTINSKLYFCGILLTGGIESSKPYNEYFFGELDSKDNNIGLDISKPIYHFSPKDDEYNLGTLKIFLDSSLKKVIKTLPQFSINNMLESFLIFR